MPVILCMKSDTSNICMYIHGEYLNSITSLHIISLCVVQLHLSSMTGELSITEEQVATYKNMMSGKEEKIAQLSQTLDSRNIQMKELKEHLKAKVAAAHPTTTAENLTAAEELVTIMIHVSKLSVELDEAKRERHQMMLKSESALQEATRLRHSIKELKNMIVSNFLHSN